MDFFGKLPVELRKGVARSRWGTGKKRGVCSPCRAVKAETAVMAATAIGWLATGRRRSRDLGWAVNIRADGHEWQNSLVPRCFYTRVPTTAASPPVATGDCAALADVDAVSARLLSETFGNAHSQQSTQSAMCGLSFSILLSL